MNEPPKNKNFRSQGEYFSWFGGEVNNSHALKVEKTMRGYLVNVQKGHITA